jgi:hypothetical protein
MAHAQKPDFVFRRNERVHLNRRGRQFSRLLPAEVCASAVVMLDTPCSEVVWRVLATHSIRQLPLHFPSVRHRVPSHFNWTLPVPVVCHSPTAEIRTFVYDGPWYVVKIKQSRNKPSVAQRVPGDLGSQISWHSVREFGEVVSLTHWPPLHPGMFLILIFTWAESTPGP